MLVPLATVGRTRSILGRRLARRQTCPTISVAWSGHESRTLLADVGQERQTPLRASCMPQSRPLMAKDVALSRPSLHLDAASTLCLVNRRRLGKAKHVDMQNLWTHEASKSGKFVTRKEGSQVNLAELMTKPPPGPQIEQLTKAMGNRFIMEESSGEEKELQELRNVRHGVQDACWWTHGENSRSIPSMRIPSCIFQHSPGFASKATFSRQSGHCPHSISSHVDQFLLDAHFQYEHIAAVLR